jgi:peptide chain release factor subunit 3
MRQALRKGVKRENTLCKWSVDERSRGAPECSQTQADVVFLHCRLAKTQGVNKLLIVVNKMDDPTVEWSEERFKECTTKVVQFLKGVGYNPKTDISMMPVSAQTFTGIKERVPKSVAPWYGGPSLLEYLDDMQALERKLNAPFMMPIAAKYKDLGTMVEGKIESGK